MNDNTEWLEKMIDDLALGQTGDEFNYDEAIVGMESGLADEYMEMAQQHFIDYPEAYADPPEQSRDRVLPPFDSDVPILDLEDDLVDPITVYTIMAVIILIALIASGAVVMLRLGL